MKHLGVKTTSIFLVLLLILPIVFMSGCDDEADEKAATSDEAVNVNYVFRSIENTYITAADSFAGGDGTETDPYQISNAAELAYLSELVNGEYTSERTAYQQAYYILTADIVINEHPDGEDWSKNTPKYAWMPIGLKNNFSGVFDGDGHTITGLYLNEDCSDKQSNLYAYGLFGFNNGVVKNLTVDKSYICVSGYVTDVGGIAGQNSLENASIENCNVEAEIYCYDASCGGIVGYNNGSITNCCFDGNLNALRDEGDTNIGGVAGANNGTLDYCKNKGGIISTESGLAFAGGISGKNIGGIIVDCVNDGDVTGAHNAGGITGIAYLSNIGGNSKSASCEIKNCTNNGTVTTDADVAGGIVGDTTNDCSDYVLSISGCVNNGKIQSAKKTGGIVGLLTTWGDVAVSDCKNTADINADVAGGVIASVSYNYGTVTVTDNQNSGYIKADTYAAGIIAENNILGTDLNGHELTIIVSGCANEGGIETNNNGGGITGTFVCPLNKNDCEKISVMFESNRHAAGIKCNNDNSFVGGISGNLGIPYADITLTDCSAEGDVIFKDIPADDETIKLETGRLELSRMSGGIVGRIGTGQYLSTTGDEKPDNAVNNPEAKIKFIRCYSVMRFDAPDESKYTYESDGVPVFLNSLGGIIGSFSGAEGYDFLVTDCEYANVERGLGDENFPDVGTKSNEAHITAKIQNLY